jgi:predicted nucleic acid-binding protein
MTVFVDTSGLYAVLDANDQDSPAAAETWRRLVETGDRLITTNYVVVECCALLHRRLGIVAMRRFMQDLVPAMMVEWVDVSLHTAGATAAVLSSNSGPGLVDCVSFALMHRDGIANAFAFDGHFRDQGFSCIP